VRIVRAPASPRLRAAVEPAPTERPKPGWRVVVADQSEARLYAADSRVSALKLLATMRNPAAWKPERELVSGRGGSKLNRTAGIRQALAPAASAHRESGERFARAVAVLAGRGLAKGERLALVAAPRLLGLITRALPAGVRDRVARTVKRDVVHERAADLRVRLKRALVEPA
jgi:protein required for attachment to host cells